MSVLNLVADRNLKSRDILWKVIRDIWWTLHMHLLNEFASRIRYLDENEKKWHYISRYDPFETDILCRQAHFALWVFRTPLERNTRKQWQLPTIANIHSRATNSKTDSTFEGWKRDWSFNALHYWFSWCATNEQSNNTRHKHGDNKQ